MAKIYKGAFSGTLPITVSGTGTGVLASYKIYGNAVQNGTPTPENPIEPSGCGERVDITGLNEPLCGIGTYTDSLELSTGILTRKIKKVVLTGNETVANTKETTTSGLYCFVYKFSDLNMSDIADYDKAMTQIAYPQFICTHFKSKAAPSTIPNDYYDISDGEIGANSVTQNLAYNRYLIICASGNNSAAAFKSYLRQQYANGTPVTVWYVLAEPEISTIPVPSGLTGTIDGYLIQDGTPAPETPIYPTANGIKQADGTYSIFYGYKLPLTVNGVEYPIYLGDAPLAKDEYVDSTTGKIYRRTENLSPPEEEWMDEWIWGDGTIHPSTEIKTSPFIDVSTCETCIMEVFSTETEWAAAGYREMAFYDENKQYLGWIGGGGRQTLTPRSTERWSEFPAGTVYVRISCSHGDQPFYPQLVSGYTPTHQFYPYLVPTDPPAPFPQIPTVAGTTVIDYAGEGLAPSLFDGVAGWGNLPVKKLNGVQWVDKQTYTRVNGEWVADN